MKFTLKDGREFDTHELAWAAGFFDGEGCSTIRINGSGSHKIFISTSQNNRTTLERFQKAVGVGRIYGPYGDHAMYTHQVYNWKEVNFMFGLFWNYLSAQKREQFKRRWAEAKADSGFGRTVKEAGLMGLKKQWGYEPPKENIN